MRGNLLSLEGCTFISGGLTALQWQGTAVMQIPSFIISGVSGRVVPLVQVLLAPYVLVPGEPASKVVSHFTI